jgi:hypothetical protein
LNASISRIFPRLFIKTKPQKINEKNSTCCLQKEVADENANKFSRQITISGFSSVTLFLDKKAASQLNFRQMIAGQFVCTLYICKIDLTNLVS